MNQQWYKRYARSHPAAAECLLALVIVLLCLTVLGSVAWGARFTGLL